MGERSDGRWASRLVGVSAPRQQGKSQLIVARALAGVLLFDEKTIICSAHQTDTAREVFQRLLDIIDANPSLESRVDSVMKAINREHIRFKSGQVIRIKARTLSGGRGFSADCLLLDEAQILGTDAWSAILPTMSARDNPQAWLLGTPPTPTDDGEVFGRLRDTGLEGKDSRSTWIEWSAEDGDDFDDPATWAKANPALGSRISLDAIESERAAMTDEQFGMERLGMWRVHAAHGVIPLDAWMAQEDPTSVPVSDFAVGIEVGADGARSTVAVAGRRDDGTWQVSLEQNLPGSTWVAPYVGALVKANPEIRAVVVDVASPTQTILADLKREGVRCTEITVKGLGQACSAVLSGVMGGTLWHLGDGVLSAAATTAGKRPLGDTGMWVWNRRAATSDITPIQAITLALWGAQAETKNVKRATPKARSETRRAVIL